MSLLTRYLMREFLRLFFLCLAGGTALYLVIDLFDRINIFVRHGAEIKWIVLFLVYKMPLMIYQIVPATVLLSVLLSLGLLTRHNEILALRTSGIPVARIAYPFVGISLVVSMGAFMLNEFVVSPTYEQSEYIRRILIEGQVPYSLKIRDRILRQGATRMEA